MKYQTILINGTGLAAIGHLRSIASLKITKSIIIAGSSNRHSMMLQFGADKCIEYSHCQKGEIVFDLALVANSSIRHINTYKTCRELNESAPVIIEKPISMPENHEVIAKEYLNSDKLARVIFQKRLLPQISNSKRYANKLGTPKLRKVITNFNKIKTKKQIERINYNYNNNLILGIIS